jgi:DNA-binding MarR family transcriptional regulator
MFSYALSKVKSVPSIGVPFAPIPLDVMRRRDLTPLAKLVFSAVANHARMRRGDSTLTNAQIAAAVGMSEPGIRRAVAELEAAGLIARQYGESQRVRASIRITYSPAEVDTQTSTKPAVAVAQHQPGCDPSVMRVDAQASASLSKNEKPTKNADVPLVRVEEDQTDPKPSPAEIASAFRMMVAGKYAPTIWSSDQSKQSATRPDPSASCRTTAEPTAAPPRDVHELARGIFVDARRAAYAKPGGGRRKTAAQQIAELAERRRRSNDSADPRPASLFHGAPPATPA